MKSILIVSLSLLMMASAFVANGSEYANRPDASSGVVASGKPFKSVAEATRWLKKFTWYNRDNGDAYHFMKAKHQYRYYFDRNDGQRVYLEGQWIVCSVEGNVATVALVLNEPQFVIDYWGCRSPDRFVNFVRSGPKSVEVKGRVYEATSIVSGR